jgi:ABC-type polar amino acid transport system ATPase subunit
MGKEVAMSDLTLVAEDILEAMHAMEDAYHATQALRKNTDPAVLDEFRTKMSALQERLEKIKMVLDNEEAYFMEELADALSMMNAGHHTEYRRTTHMRAE